MPELCSIYGQGSDCSHHAESAKCDPGAGDGQD
nr:MAG TPA_asm: zinc finger protein [Caudoviricetes sp.]